MLRELLIVGILTVFVCLACAEAEKACQDETTNSVADAYKPSAEQTSAETLREYAASDGALHAYLGEHIPQALQHTGAADFDEHLKGVQGILRFWGASEAVASAGLFHSIYGTEGFQGYSLPLSQQNRNDVKELIGERAERLCFCFCMVDRSTVDQAVFDDAFFGGSQNRTLVSRPELGRFPIHLSDQDWYDFVELTLADWLEQVEGAALTANPLFRWNKGQAWSYRRTAYVSMAKLLSSREERLQVAAEMHQAVYATEPQETRHFLQPRTPPMCDAAEKAYAALGAAGQPVPDTWAPISMSSSTQ